MDIENVFIQCVNWAISLFEMFCRAWSVLTIAMPEFGGMNLVELLTIDTIIFVVVFKLVDIIL